MDNFFLSCFPFEDVGMADDAVYELVVFCSGPVREMILVEGVFVGFVVGLSGESH